MKCTEHEIKLCVPCMSDSTEGQICIDWLSYDFQINELIGNRTVHGVQKLTVR